MASPRGGGGAEGKDVQGRFSWIDTSVGQSVLSHSARQGACFSQAGPCSGYIVSTVLGYPNKGWGLKPPQQKGVLWLGPNVNRWGLKQW